VIYSQSERNALPNVAAGLSSDRSLCIGRAVTVESGAGPKHLDHLHQLSTKPVREPNEIRALLASEKHKTC
jgi:hypothetical protein